MWWRVDWGEKPQAKLEWSLLKRVFSYFIPYWRHALVVLLCIAVTSAMDFIPALVTKLFIDDALNLRARLPGFVNGNRFTFVVLLVLVLVISSPLSGVIRVGQSYFSNLISQGIMFDLRNQLFGRMLQQTVSFFTRTKTGDLMSRLSNDVNGIQSVVSDTIFSLVSNVVILVFGIVLMFLLDWRLTLVSLAVLPAFVLPTRRVGNATFEARKRTQSKLSELTAYMQEVLGISGILLVKAFVKQQLETRRFRNLNGELRDLNIRQAMIGRWFFMLMGTLGTFGPAIIWLYGGYLFVNHQVSVGTVVTFATALLSRLYGPVGSLANLQVNVIGSLALFQRLFEYLDMPLEISDRPGAVDIGDIAGAVAFEDVTFSYGSGRRALDEVTFQVEPGQLVALVGPSGAGKTTITNLLARFYEPQQGRVTVDGHDIRDVTLQSLGRQMGMVFQDTFLFHASVRDNLVYARPDATEEQITVAARAANIHDFIESLPEGYDTLVGERGHRLSGGEKQRLAIARVILKDPRILILDEATSNLDSESERLIQAALRPLFERRTSFVIAHRLSTVLAADVILVLEAGRLVERGTHFELLNRSGTYARLYETQFAGFPREVPA